MIFTRLGKWEIITEEITKFWRDYTPLKNAPSEKQMHPLYEQGSE